MTEVVTLKSLGLEVTSHVIISVTLSYEVTQWRDMIQNIFFNPSVPSMCKSISTFS